MAVDVWLGLGSNQGDRESFLIFGLEKLAQIGNIRLLSSLYETEPWGEANQPYFLNAVCQLSTGLEDPLDFLDTLKEIEGAAGRQSGEGRWGPRPLDIDVLFWGRLVLDSDGLTVPHPRMAQRRFVLEPLAEVAPDLRHPVTNLSIREMLQRCSDPKGVCRYGTFAVKGQMLGRMRDKI